METREEMKKKPTAQFHKQKGGGGRGVQFQEDCRVDAGEKGKAERGAPAPVDWEKTQYEGEETGLTSRVPQRGYIEGTYILRENAA